MDDRPFLSQSQAGAEQRCGLQWFGTYYLGYFPVGVDDRPRRLGTLGHGLAAGALLAAWSADATSCFPIALEWLTRAQRWAIADELAERERWPTATFYDWPGDVADAEVAAERLLAFLDARPDLLAVWRGQPLVERRVRIPWSSIRWLAEELEARGADVVLGRFAGLEGAMDLVERLPSGTLLVSDPKFRREVPQVNAIDDEGDAETRSVLPDLQGSWYSVVLEAALPGARSVEFRQVQVYAGPMLTADDYLRPGSPLVTDDGLPSLAPRNVTADEWSRAWETLVAHKSATETRGRGRNKEPWTPTPNQENKAREHLERLRTRPLVAARGFPLDPLASREVVVDACVRVDAALRVAARTRPGRVLSNHPGSPCMRRNGCDMQGPCRASLGSGNFDAVLASMAADGRFSTRAERQARDADAPR